MAGHIQTHTEGTYMATESLISKLEAFSETLEPEEREVLGELLQHSVDDADVEGFGQFGQTSSLGSAIFSAQSASRTFTRFQLSPVGNGIVLVAAGPVAGGGGLSFNH